MSHSAMKLIYKFSYLGVLELDEVAIAYTARILLPFPLLSHIETKAFTSVGHLCWEEGHLVM